MTYVLPGRAAGHDRSDIDCVLMVRARKVRLLARGQGIHRIGVVPCVVFHRDRVAPDPIPRCVILDEVVELRRGLRAAHEIVLVKRHERRGHVARRSWCSSVIKESDVEIVVIDVDSFVVADAVGVGALLVRSPEAVVVLPPRCGPVRGRRARRDGDVDDE